MATPFIGVYAKTYGPYQGSGGGNITPAPPSWSFNSDTRVLTLTHGTYGASELEFSYRNATYEQYVAGLSVDAAQHPAGDWKARVKAATGRNRSNLADSPAISIKPGNTLQDYFIPDANYADSPFSQNITLGGVSGKLHGTLSGAKGTTPATVIKLGMRGNVGTLGFPAATLGVFVNEVYQRIDFQSTADEDLQSVLNLPAGDKTIRFVNTDLARAGSGTTNVVGSFIARIQANAPFTWQAPTAPAKRYLILTDSIGSGNNAANKATESWAALFRAYVGSANGVAVDGYSGGSFDDIYGPNAPRPATLARTFLGLDGTAENTAIYALGVNDALLNTNGAASRVGANLTAYVQDIRAQRPATKIIVITPTPHASRDGEVEAVRQQLRTAAASLGNVLLIEGPSLVTTADLDTDGLHLTTAGQRKYFDNFIKAFTGGPGAATGAGAFIDEFDAGSVNTALWGVGYLDTAKPSVAITQANGQLLLRATTASNDQSGLTTKVARDMSGGRSFSCKVPAQPAGSDSLFLMGICSSALKQADSANAIAITGGQLIAQGLNFAQPNKIAYDPIAHAYLRLVEYSGHLVYQYSADNQTWNTLYDNANVGFALTSVYLAVGGGSTSSNATGSPTGCTIDWVRYSLDTAITPPTPVPYPQQFGNSDFSQPLGTDYTLEFIAAVAEDNGTTYFKAGGGAATANGLVQVTNDNLVATVATLVQNGIYELVMVLDSIGGGAAQIIGTAGEGQINEAKMGAGTGRTPGTYKRTFTSTFNGPASFIMGVTGAPGPAYITKATLTRLS